MAATPVVNIGKIPELRKRLFFSLVLVAVYRIGVHIPTPGINPAKLEELMRKGKSLFDMLNLFSGGAIEKLSIFALGIMPYISASIIFQLLTVVVPAFERLSKEGDQGRKKIAQYTRYGTIVLSLVQGFVTSMGLYKQNVLLPDVGGFSFYFQTMLTFTAGTAFVMWLGEQITERGIGNGISLIIFSGIVSRIPSAMRDAWVTKHQFKGSFGFLMLLVFIFFMVAFVIFLERSQRRIPIQYAKRVIGRKMYGGQSTHMPLKINSAGVIPPIFASSLMIFPTQIAQFSSNPTLIKIAGALSQGWLHDAIYVSLIIFFAYFYTAVTFNPIDVSDNIRKNGGFVPGIRPGQATADFIDHILSRITLGGALYIASVCILPNLLTKQFAIPSSLASTFGGTSVLIVVGVAMDTLAQIESHLMMRNYEGLMGEGGGRFRGRK